MTHLTNTAALCVSDDELLRLAGYTFGTPLEYESQDRVERRRSLQHRGMIVPRGSVLRTQSWEITPGGWARVSALVPTAEVADRPSPKRPATEVSAGWTRGVVRQATELLSDLADVLDVISAAQSGGVEARFVGIGSEPGVLFVKTTVPPVTYSQVRLIRAVGDRLLAGTPLLQASEEAREHLVGQLAALGVVVEPRN